MSEAATIPISPLAEIVNLLDVLHKNNIRYCHWKSNEHLAASMTGDTDLDILFDEKQKVTIENILHSIGFKKFNAIRQKQYHDIVDFLGIDLQSGKIIHIHTHYRLTMGEPYLKGYQLGLEENILNSRIFDKEYGIYCINPPYELILLYLREALKIRHRDVLLIHVKNKIRYSENVLREYEWLRNRSSETEIQGILKNIFTDYYQIYEFIKGDFNRIQLNKLAPLIKKEFAKKRLYSSTRALMLRWYREATVIISRKLKRITSTPFLAKRINPRGGLVVAVIGADGSGKSTVTTDLLKTFETKLDVFKIYFGRGDGNISVERKLLSSFKSKDKIKNQTSVKAKKSGFIKTLFKCLEAILVANEKRVNLKKMKSAKEKGMIVICDRYPQNQIMGYNDGPLLHHLITSKNVILRFLAKVESKVYKNAEINPPDLLIKLIAEAEVVERRKPGETSIEKLKTKIEGIKSLKFNCKEITIDASQPLVNVLTLVKKEIWNNL